MKFLKRSQTVADRCEIIEEYYWHVWNLNVDAAESYAHVNKQGESKMYFWVSYLYLYTQNLICGWKNFSRCINHILKIRSQIWGNFSVFEGLSLRTKFLLVYFTTRKSETVIMLYEFSMSLTCMNSQSCRIAILFMYTDSWRVTKIIQKVELNDFIHLLKIQFVVERPSLFQLHFSPSKVSALS